MPGEDYHDRPGGYSENSLTNNKQPIAYQLLANMRCNGLLKM